MRNVFQMKEWDMLLLLLFSRSVVPDSLQPHGLQHTRLPCPSLSPKACSTHVYWVGDAIQPFQPLSSPSPPAFNLSQHQGPFQWVSSLHQVAKVLELESCSALKDKKHENFMRDSCIWLNTIYIYLCRHEISRIFFFGDLKNISYLMYFYSLALQV